MNFTDPGFSSATSYASTDAPAPSGESEKSNTTGGFSSEISPRSLAYFLSVTFFTTAPHVESSSFTSSLSSTTIFSGVAGSAGAGSAAAFVPLFAEAAASEADGCGAAASAVTFVAAIAACSARYFWRSLARPISFHTYQARTTPRRRQMIFSVLFIDILMSSNADLEEYFTINPRPLAKKTAA